MNTRSKTKSLTQLRDTGEMHSESQTTVAGGLGKFPELDSFSTEATNTPAVVDPVSVASRQNPTISSELAKSDSRSGVSVSSRSSATVIKARKLTAEALLARKSLEREEELLQREHQLAEQKLARDRKLLQQVTRVEELELLANLASQEAKENSFRSVSQSRTQSWVDDCQPFPQNDPKKKDMSTTHDQPILTHSENHNLEPNNDICLTARPVKPSNKNNSHRISYKYVELMPFSGKATEWLMFKRTYNDTQHLFTPTENLARLRCALRGRALESVSALLYTAEHPKAVVDMLEKTFALPETIVLHEISLVRNLPKISHDQRELNSFACRLRNCIAVINSLHQKEYLYSIEIFHTVLSKLTPILYSQWKDYAYRSDQSVPKLQVLSTFLDIEADKQNRFGLVLDLSKRPNAHQGGSDFIRRESMHVTSTRSTSTGICRYCKNKHELSECSDFKALPLDDKWRWLRDVRICYKCLKLKAHRWKTCRINRCGVDGCERFHNPLLHSTPPIHATHAVNDLKCISPEADDQARIVTISNTTESVLFGKNISQSRVFLKIVPVEVTGPTGTYDTYALLDDGSTATLIDSEVARRIGAIGPVESIKVDGVAGMSTHKPIQQVSFSIKGKNCSDAFSVTNAKAIDTLTLFTQTITRDDLYQCSHLINLIDELTLVDATPKILLGADHWYLTVSRDLREGSKNQPVATRTALGWVLHGKCGRWTKPFHFANHVCLDDNNDFHLDSLIKDYFRLDAIGISNLENSCSKQDQYALEILESTAKRLPSGRFEVGLLWRNDIRDVPDSYPQALSRFLGLEKRMERDDNFKKGYCTFINNMLEKGYAEECSKDTYHNEINSLYHINKIRWYLPHFSVVHPQKKKLRVVHDAAARTSGVSLNSLLFPGPALLQSLLHILFRFREGRVALTADIKEMFPQIKMREHDRDALRFLWREDRSSELKEYRMTSVIFGAVCSPCTALYIKNRNAQELHTLYPAAAKAIIDDHYMDDFLGSMDDAQEASQLAADIITIHRSAGMEMRGWVSNEPAALTGVPEDLRAATPKNIDVGPENIVRTLGLIWHPQSDTFSFRNGSQIDSNDKLTKRKVLSYLMCVYDPLGLLTPFVIQGRILFQQTWRTGIDWDTELQPDIVQKWLFWSRQLANISKIKFPRWHRCGFKDKTISDRQLHVLADASEQAYSCVAYWRFTFLDSSVKLSLIGGKARLAPLKPTSIPRLELQAALIAARFANTVITGHNVQVNQVYFWSDSTTVLSWIRSDARCFKPFVANRVGEITESTNVNSWKFVPGSLNVADDATRLKDRDTDLNRWLSGPEYLLHPQSEWPKPPPSFETSIGSEELKPSKAIVGLTSCDEVLSPVIPNPLHFSKWNRLVRATARVYQCAFIFRSLLTRFKGQNSKLNSTNASSSKLPTLRGEDIQKAENAILKKTQMDSFGPELTVLHDPKQSKIPKTSRLHSLALVLDEEGLLRLDSRIKYMKNMDYNTTSPIILDGRHPAVRLLIQSYHLKAAHAFNELVCNELKQRYWILRCRSEVRKISRNCAFCLKRKVAPQTPPIGDLPDVRLDCYHRPFTNVGLDYFGPVNVSIGRRREKRWVALFTCLTTRAVHLEIVASLSADSAISCLRRFIARRGVPRKILSDNGTAFIGANRQLTDFFCDAVHDFVANNQIEWSFIPPASPFMGGCWERLIRCVKTALQVTLREKAPREELLHTLLLEAEAIVNSRPLTYVAADNEYQSLTPFHFLIGSSSNQQLPTPLDDTVFSLRKEWKKALRLSEIFWCRWLKEYLSLLKTKKQHGGVYRNLSVDDVVLVVDPDLPRGVWPMGRVTKVYPGKDGVVRVADVATKGGTLKRPTRKLAVLPLQ